MTSFTYLRGTDSLLFDSQNALHATSPSVWLPYASLDQLLVLLKDVQPDTELAKVCHLQLYHELSYSIFTPR